MVEPNLDVKEASARKAPKFRSLLPSKRVLLMIILADSLTSYFCIPTQYFVMMISLDF